MMRERRPLLAMLLAGSVMQTAIVAGAENPAELLRRAKAATALVDLGIAGSGSAFCIRKDGLFVTNRHVVEIAGAGGRVTLVLNPAQENEQTLTARVVHLGTESDLALLKLTSGRPAAVLPLGTLKEVFETTPVTVLGYPFGRLLATDPAGYPSISVNRGRISALRRTNGTLSALQIDASVNPGNSGGPVIDETGKVVGVTTAMVPGTSIVFAQPVSTLQDFLSRPGLVLDAPEIRYRERDQPARFQVEVTAFTPEAMPDALELVLANGGQVSRHRAKKRSTGFEVVAPVAAERKPLPLRLRVRAGEELRTATVNDQQLRIGSRPVHLLEVRRIERRVDTQIVTLVSGQKLAGPVAGLEGLKAEALDGIDLGGADRIDIHAAEPIADRIDYELIATKNEKVLSTATGVISLYDTPIPIDEPGRALVDGYAPDVQRITVEARIDGKSVLHVTPNGLIWAHYNGENPGEADGRSVLINGRKWSPEWNADYAPPDDSGQDAPEAVSGKYPLKIGYGLWDWTLLSVLERPDGRVDRSRAKIKADYEDGDFRLAIEDTAAGSAVYRIRLRKQTGISDISPRSGPALAGAWSFDESDGLPVRPDGRITAASAYVPGRIGRALALEPGSVDCGKTADFERTDAFSYGAWIYPTDAPFGAVISKMSDRGPHRGFDLFFDHRRLIVHVISTWEHDCLKVMTADRIPFFQWTHVLVTYDGSSRASGIRMYVNGEPADLEATHDSLNNTIRTDVPLRIGSRTNRQHFRGFVDEVRIYNRTLSAEEAAVLGRADSDETPPLERGLVGYWPFDDDTDGLAKDASGNGADGRIKSGSPAIVRVPGRKGGALTFRGEGTVFCEGVGEFERDEPFACGAWVRPESSNLMVVIDRMELFEPHRGYELRLENNTIRVLIVNAFAQKEFLLLSTVPIIQQNEWQHVMFTYDGSGRAAGVAIYHNGQPMECEILQDSLAGSIRHREPVRIGRRGGLQFKGAIDEAFILPRLPTAAEIESLAAGERSVAEVFGAESPRP